MKLLLIITDLGSFNNFLSDLSLEFCSEKKNELHVICSDVKIINVEDKYSFDNKNIHFHHINIPRTFNLINLIKSSFSIRSKIENIKPDLVHVHFTTAAFPTLLLKNNKCTYWSTFHGLGMNSTIGIKKILFTIIEIYCSIRSAKIFVLNNEDFSLLKYFFSKKTLKHDCLGVGCDLVKFNINNFTLLDKVSLHEKHNINRDQIVIAFTGRFVHFKGFDIVLRTFKKLTLKSPNKFKLLLIGDQDRVHATGLSADDLLFFNTSLDIIKTGYTKDVHRYLSIANIFLFPSKKEGLPTCIIEALSMGVPVITFNARGNNDLVKNQYNGLLVEPNFSKELEISNFIQCINLLTNDKSLYLKLSNNAINNRSKYSRINFVTESMAHYQKYMIQSNE